jgi:hypothetical protein
MRRLWLNGAVAGLAALMAVLPGRPALAQSISPISLREDAQAGRTTLLTSYYRSGLVRLDRGDPAGARGIFETASAGAPGIPQIQAALAAAIVLADFTAREQALPAIRAALAADPGDPLYRVIEVLADPAQSVLEADGDLALSDEGAKTIGAAARLLASTRAAPAARDLALLLATRAQTGNAALPECIPGFAAMLGPDERARLGRRFALAVPDAAFKPYEAAFVERLLQGLASRARMDFVTADQR